MKGFEEALAECLASLERGRSVEECLARYPGLTQELEPLLRTALRLQQTYDVGPRPSFQRAARQRFLMAARRGRRPLVVAPPPRRLSFGWRWAPAGVAAAALVAAVALAAVLTLAGGGSSGEVGVTVRHASPTVTSPTEATPEPEEIDALVQRLEKQLDAMQEQVEQGAVIPSEAIQELKDTNQSLEQTLPAAPPAAAEAASQIADLLDQQKQVLSAASEQGQVAPEAAGDVDEVIRIAGTIQELLLPTATPSASPVAAPTGTPAPSLTATQEASATATPASSSSPGSAGGEIIVPLTPTPSP